MSGFPVQGQVLHFYKIEKNLLCYKYLLSIYGVLQAK